MSLILNGTDGITFPNSTEQASAGSVLQVVNFSVHTTVSSSTSTYVDSGITATITPKFSTSKILIIVDATGLYKATNNAAIGLKLVRNSTDLLVFEALAGYTNTTTSNGVGGSGVSYLDSPTTTSATIYKVQFASLTNNATVYVNQNYTGVGNSTITLMEIAA